MGGLALRSFIREFDLGDLNRVEHIELNTFPNPWTRRIFYNRYLDEPELFLVACVNGEVVGYIVGATEKGGTVGHIMNVAVNEGWKGRGIGTSLLRELEARFIDENVDLAYLEVRISNDRAQKLYRRLGYSKASRIEGYYNDEDALLMVKDMKKR